MASDKRMHMAHTSYIPTATSDITCSCRGVPFRSCRLQPQPLVTQWREVKVRVEMRNGTGPCSYPRWEHENNFLGHTVWLQRLCRASPCSLRLAGPCCSTLRGIHPYLETDITSIACRKARRSLFPCRNFDTAPPPPLCPVKWVDARAVQIYSVGYSCIPIFLHHVSS